MTNETMKDGDRAAFEAIATKIHYPACWDTAAYPTLASALVERAQWYDWQCGECAAPSQSGEKEIARLEKVGREFEGYFGHIAPEEACRTINELQGKLNARAAAPQAALTDEQRDAIKTSISMLETRSWSGDLYLAAHLKRLLTQAPTERMSDAARPSAFGRLVAAHAEFLDANAYCYFELAYTRQTGWMAWITDRPAQGESGTAEYAKSRRVIARGQGDTAEDACADAMSVIDAARKAEIEPK